MTFDRITRDLTLAAEERLIEEDEITLPAAGTLTYLGVADTSSEEPGLPLYWRDPAGQVWAVTVAVTAQPVAPARIPAAVRQRISS